MKIAVKAITDKRSAMTSNAQTSKAALAPRGLLGEFPHLSGAVHSSFVMLCGTVGEAQGSKEGTRA